MEKLIEYLNEYEKLNMWRWFVYYCERDDTIENTNEFIKVSEVISKRYGFIQWLVDNNKIRKDIYRPIPFKIKIEYEDGVRYIEKLEDRILMELSIQDNPIEFLIGILK